MGGTAGNVTRVLTACDTSEHQQQITCFIIPFLGFLAGSPSWAWRPVSILFQLLVLKKRHGQAECFKINQSIVGSYSFFSPLQVTALVQLSSNLLSIVDRRRGKVMVEEEAEQAINRQTALYSLKLLCRSFGSDHQEAFIPVLQQTVEIVTSAEEEKNVTGSALLCIAEVVSTLKALAIPQLPRWKPPSQVYWAQLGCWSLWEASSDLWLWVKCEIFHTSSYLVYKHVRSERHDHVEQKHQNQNQWSSYVFQCHIVQSE